jgi:hypothetical protein
MKRVVSERVAVGTERVSRPLQDPVVQWTPRALADGGECLIGGELTVLDQVERGHERAKRERLQGLARPPGVDGCD